METTTIRQRLWLPAALVCLTLLLIAACASPHQQLIQNYQRVQAGWTLDEVRSVLGEPTRVFDARGVGGVWEYRALDKDGAPVAVLHIISLGGVVISAKVSQPGN